MATDPAVQAASRVLHGGESPGITRDTCSACCSAEAVVAAITPIIRAQAFIEAAEALTDRWPPELFSHTFYADDASIIRDLADLVRGLGEETENA
jgi:hypothetical protein